MKWDIFQFCTKNSCLSKKNNFRIFENKILIILSWGFFWGTFSVIFSFIYFVISEANFIFITSFIYFYTYLIYPGVTLNLQKLNINASWFFDAIKFYYFFTAHFQLTKLLLYSAPRLFYEALNNCSRVSFFYDCASHCGFWPNFRCKNYEGNLITIFPKLPEEQMQVSFISHDSGSKGSLTGSKTATNNKIHLH